MSDKYHRLITFVIDICPKPMRELFVAKAKADNNTQYTNLEDYLRFRKPDVDKLLRRSRITFEQYDHIYPASGCVSIQIWDVTLLSTQLRGVFGNDLQQDERDCLDVITNIRNRLQHISGTRNIIDKDFNSSWSALKDAVLTLSKYAGAPHQHSVEQEISSALTENMPNLGDVLRTWHQVLYVQLQLQNSELEKKLDLQAVKIKNLKDESKKSSTILSKASVKRKGRSGIAEKRLKIVDNKVERMREIISRALSEDNDCTETFKKDILLITEQLTDNNRVIVAGYDNMLTYKCALAAVTKLKFKRLDQCLEIDNPADWKRIFSDDARCVLFREPFGRASYDPRKVETMLEEFDNLIDATNVDNEDVMYIIIVTNQSLLQKVRRINDHEMLSPASTVYIDSTADHIPDDNRASEDTVHRNLSEFSKMYKERYSLKIVDKHSKDEAERLFLAHNTVTIVGPAGSGKTSLSFQLLPCYDLSNGEENFLVIMDPGKLKYVNFSLKPVIIIRLFANMGFDKVEAGRWYNEFDMLLAAVKENKVAVITIIRTEVFQTLQANMPTHPVLEQIVNMPGTKAKENEEKMQDNVSIAVQTDEARDGHGQCTSEDDSTTERCCQIRSVKAIRSYDIKSRVLCVLPTGEILLLNFPSRLIKMNYDFDAIIDVCDLQYVRDNLVSNGGMCYAGNNVAVIAVFGGKLLFVNIIKEMKLIRILETDHGCSAVACHGSQMYVTDDKTVYLYTSDGEYQKVLYTDDDCFFSDIAVSNDGGMIYIKEKRNLITIDSSGNHCITLENLSFSRFDLCYCLCVDNLGNVYSISSSNDKSEIVQVSPDGRQKLGTVFELDNRSESIHFNTKRSSLLVVAIFQDKLTELTLR